MTPDASESWNILFPWEIKKGTNLIAKYAAIAAYGMTHMEARDG